MENANYQSENPERVRYAAQVGSDYVAGEAVRHWVLRGQSHHLMNIHRAEILTLDAVLGELLYRQKRKISRLGRNGAWSKWLQQNNIMRSTADRLALEFAEWNQLADELPHRNHAEPLEGRISQAAYRESERVENMLKSPKSRMTFIRCLADLLELTVDYDGDAVRLSIPPPFNEDEWKNEAVPAIYDMQPDGTPRPFSYELRDEAEGSPL